MITVFPKQLGVDPSNRLSLRLVFVLFLLGLWGLFFPAKGAIYQFCVYLIPLVILSDKKLRLCFADLWGKYRWFFLMILVPLFVSDLVAVMFSGSFSGLRKIDFVFSWRIFILPLSIVSLLCCLRPSLKKISYFLIFTFSCYAFAGLIEFFFAVKYFEKLRWMGRMDGFVFNPNPFGLLMAFAAVLTSFWMIRSRAKAEIILFLCLTGLFLFCCVMSGSRGALIALLAGEILVFSHKLKLFLYFMASCGLMWAILVFFERYRLHSLIRYKSFFTSNARVAIFKKYSAAIIEKPFWGYGSVSDLLVEVGPKHVIGGGAHNIFVEVAFRTGGIGLIFFIIFSIVFFRLAWRYRSESPCLALLLVLYVAGLFDNSFYTSSIYQSFFAITIIFCLSTAHRFDLTGTRDVTTCIS